MYIFFGKNMYGMTLIKKCNFQSKYLEDYKTLYYTNIGMKQESNKNKY